MPFNFKLISLLTEEDEFFFWWVQGHSENIRDLNWRLHSKFFNVRSSNIPQSAYSLSLVLNIIISHECIALWPLILKSLRSALNTPQRMVFKNVSAPPHNDNFVKRIKLTECSLWRAGSLRQLISIAYWHELKPKERRKKKSKNWHCALKNGPQ